MDLNLQFTCIILVYCFCFIDGSVHEGCYRENKRKRYFSNTPGDFTPSAMTPALCASKCGSFKYTYCAVTQGQFCFCGNSLPPLSNKDSGSACNMPCLGDSSYMCGALDYVNIYSTAPPIVGLEVAVSNGVISINNDVTFSASYSSAGKDVTFQLDYGDNGGKTDKNQTSIDMWTKRYYTPGQYQVTLFGNDVINSVMEKEATTSVMVEAPPANASFSCQDFMATHEEGVCQLSVVEGTSLQVTAKVDGTVSSTFYIADPPIYSTGPNFPSGVSALVGGETTTASTVVVMPASEFQQRGTLIGFEYYGSQVGSVTFYILRPSCVNYCFDTNTCSSSCSAIFTRVCSSGLQFCPAAGTCWDSSGPTCNSVPVRYNGNQRTNLQIVASIPHVITTTSYNYVSIVNQYNVQVEPGDVLGYQGPAGKLQSMNSTAAESDLMTSNVANAAIATTLSSPQRHLLKAVVSAGSNVALPFTFTTTGTKTIGITLSNTVISTTISLSDTVSVMEGINSCRLSIGQYIETGSAVQFSLLPHTGTSVMYTWDYGNGNTVNKTTPQHTYTYSSRGTYNVTVTCFNQMSTKSNITSLIVQDRITGLSLSSPPAVVGEVTSVTLGMTSGSDYTCAWSRNGVVIEHTSVTQTPPNGSYTVTFAEDGTYIISVTCENNINSMSGSITFNAQRRIKGFALERTGALLNNPFTVDFLWTDGTSPHFLLEFDGVEKTLIIDYFSRKGKSATMAAVPSPTSFPLNLTAYNLVSNEQISVLFGIESEIIGAIVSSDVAINSQLGYGTVAKGDTVTFTANAAAGTNVEIKWEHTENGGSAAISTQTISVWTAPVPKSFILNNLGYHDVKVTIKNAYSSADFTFRYLAIVPVQNIAFNSISPVLFVPPSHVNFTFMQTVPGLAPNEATIQLNYGDGKMDTLSFDLNGNYPYTYRDDGTFTVTANISNIVSSLTITTTVEVVEKIDKLQILPNPPHAPKGEPVDVNVQIFRGGTGSKLQLRWKFETTGSFTAFQDRTGASPYGNDTKQHTYNVIGSNTITVEAKNTLETVAATYTIECQEKVTDNFVVTTNFPLDFAASKLITYTLTYSGPTPTNAKIVLNYGDGTQSAEIPFTSSPLQHTYSTDGHFITSYTIFNKVSSKTVKVNSGVYKQFVNCRLDLKWKPLVPLNGPDLDGYGAVKNIFPKDTPVKVYVTCDQGTVVYYEVNAFGPSLLECNKTEVGMFELDFTSLATGTYTLTVTPRNPLFQVTMTKTFELLDPCKDIIIEDGGIGASAYQWKKFNMSFGLEGTQTCVHVDFGDGTQGELYGYQPTCNTFSGTATYIGSFSNTSSKTEFQHEYASEGTYIVAASGFNAYSTCATNFTHVITDVDCTRPKLNIKDVKSKFYQPENVKKSDRIRVIGVTDIACALTLKNEKIWTVHKVDENTGEDVSSIDVTGQSSHTSAELTLPPLFLDYGTYRMNYRMNMVSENFVKNESYTTDVNHFIKIVKSDLVALILDGGVTKIQRGFAKNVTLEPEKFSYDPDIASSASQTFSNFTWYCRKANETLPLVDNPSLPYTTAQLLTNPAENGGCFKQGPGRIDTYAGILTFDTANMVIDETYIFAVQVRKDDRMSQTTVQIEIIAGDPPDLTIRCGTALCTPRATGQLIRPSNRLSLTSECQGCTPNTVFEWKVYQSNYQWTWKEIIELPTYVDGVHSTNIAIKPGLFSLDPSVKQYQVKLNIRRDDGQEANAFTTLLINDPPKDGSCSINPKVGIATQDKFSVVCSGWVDEDGIASYSVYVTYKDDPQERQVIFGSQSTYQVNLPMGPDYDNYSMMAYVRIEDILGAYVTVDLGKVQVNSIPRDSINSKLKSMQTELKDDLDLAFARADLNEVNEVALIYASMINMASKIGVQTEYAGVDVAGTQKATGLGPDYNNRVDAFDKTATSYEKEDKYQAEREVYSQTTIQISKALQTVTFADPASVALTASTCAEVTKYTENCARPCQEGIENVTKNMMDALVAQADKITVEEVQLAAKGIVNTLSNLIEAGNVHTKYPTDGDMESVSDIAEYDTDRESLDKAMPSELIGNYARANKKLLAYTNEPIQAATTRGVESTKNDIYTKLRKIFEKKLVEGEQPVTLSTTSIVLSYEKNRGGNLSNKTINLGDGSFLIPNWCSLQPKCDPNSTVMLQASYSIYHPYAFTTNAKDLTTYAGSLNIDLFDSNGDPISVTDASEPIELKVPLDRNMPVPGEKYVEPFIPNRDWEYFFYHTAEMTTRRGALQVRFRLDDSNQQFLVLIRRGGTQNISTEFDFLCMIPSSMHYKDFFGNNNTPDPYTCFVGSDEMNGYTGQVSIGVRQMSNVEHDRYLSKSYVPASFPKGSGTFSTNYTVQTVSSNCQFFNETLQDWDTRGCSVGALTSSKTLQCICTHLTTFSGGWVVVPNTIDWNFVFSNMDFFKNPTLYITEIVIALTYIITVIWARREDKKDVEKLGLTPLADNDKKDRYYYEIVVITGMRRNAGTESKVSFILTGDQDETDVRIFSDNKRNIFRRGGVDGFLMAVPKPLGALSYLHIWHDNSGKGKFASWYLRNVVVRDVQTDQKFIFISNQWFAVEEDDGMIDRLIPVAGLEQMTEFSHLFTEKTTKSLSDGHLWFSVLARPPQSRFTRVQRVSCCLCLLFMTMLTNAMFYERGESQQNAFTFGPFALTPEQIYIGVVSNLIVFPVNFLVVIIFRKSRPRKKRPSRIEEALKDKSKTVASMSDVNPTFKCTTPPCITPSQLLKEGRPETSISRAGTSLSVMDIAIKEEGKKKQKKRDLPWYFIIVGWILLWLATLISAAFVTFYGIMFQDVKCKKWITSLLISFFTSIFITQPVKVLLTAIFFSLVIKNPGGDEDDDEADDEENPKLKQDEEFLHEPDTLFGITRPRKPGYKPPNPTLLQKARDVRLKEIKMWEVVRELVFYAFFLWILMVISYRNRSANSYYYKRSLEQVFIDSNETRQNFTKIHNKDEFWKWAKSGMVNGIRAGVYYNDDQPLFLRGYINDKQSRIMGYATMRQVRTQKDTCRVPDVMTSIVHECNGEYHIFDQDEGRYGTGWTKPYPNSSNVREEYVYTDSSALEGYPYWGDFVSYSGGGYVVRLRGNSSFLQDKMSQLESEGWIDRYTRAIFVEFTVYNPGINLFGIATLLLEVRPSQGIFPSYRFEPVMLLPYMNSVMLFQIACEIVYFAFTLFFLAQLIKGLVKEKFAYFKQFWNLVELGICSMSVTAVVIYFYRLFETKKLTERFKVSHGNEYMKFQYIGTWSEIFSYIIGWLVFFASLKFLKLLRFNKRMSLLASTLRSSCRDMMHFSVIFTIVFMAFIQLFFLVYATSLPSFKTFVTSCESGLVMMMGKFDIYEMKMVEPVMTQIFIFLYVVTITFIVVNMFLSILNETFGVVRSDIAKINNDYEIVEFMVNRFKLWTGLGQADRSVLSPEDVRGLKSDTLEGRIDNFSDRIDQLLSSVSNEYMEKERLDALFEWNAGEKAKMKAAMRIGSHPPPKSQKYQDCLPSVHTNY